MEADSTSNDAWKQATPPSNQTASKLLTMGTNTPGSDQSQRWIIRKQRIFLTANEMQRTVITDVSFITGMDLSSSSVFLLLGYLLSSWTQMIKSFQSPEYLHRRMF